MNFVIMMIGAAHALSPVIGVALANAKAGVILGAIVANLIAATSGYLAFVGIDLIGFGIGTWLANHLNSH